MKEMPLFWNTATVDSECPSQSNQFAFLKSTMYRSRVSKLYNQTTERTTEIKSNEPTNKIEKYGEETTRGRVARTQLLEAKQWPRVCWLQIFAKIKVKFRKCKQCIRIQTMAKVATTAKCCEFLRLLRQLVRCFDPCEGILRHARTHTDAFSIYHI